MKKLAIYLLLAIRYIGTHLRQLEDSEQDVREYKMRAMLLNIRHDMVKIAFSILMGRPTDLECMILKGQLHSTDDDTMADKMLKDVQHGIKYQGSTEADRRLCTSGLANDDVGFLLVESDARTRQNESDMKQFFGMTE